MASNKSLATQHSLIHNTQPHNHTTAAELVDDLFTRLEANLPTPNLIPLLDILRRHCLPYLGQLETSFYSSAPFRAVSRWTTMSPVALFSLQIISFISATVTLLKRAPDLVLALVALGYPSYKSIRILDRSSKKFEDDTGGGEEEKSERAERRQWMMYWILYGWMQAFNTIFKRSLSKLPARTTGRIALLIWLQADRWRGATQLYEAILGPFLRAPSPELLQKQTAAALLIERRRLHLTDPLLAPSTSSSPSSSLSSIESNLETDEAPSLEYFDAKGAELSSTLSIEEVGVKDVAGSEEHVTDNSAVAHNESKAPNLDSVPNSAARGSSTASLVDSPSQAKVAVHKNYTTSTEKISKTRHPTIVESLANQSSPYRNSAEIVDLLKGAKDPVVLDGSKTTALTDYKTPNRQTGVKIVDRDRALPRMSNTLDLSFLTNFAPTYASSSKPSPMFGDSKRPNGRAVDGQIHPGNSVQTSEIAPASPSQRQKHRVSIIAP